VKIEFNFGGYKYLTDNTKEVDIDTIFLLTNQNKKYQKSLQKRTKSYYTKWVNKYLETWRYWDRLGGNQGTKMVKTQPGKQGRGIPTPYWLSWDLGLIRKVGFWPRGTRKGRLILAKLDYKLRLKNQSILENPIQF